MPKLTITLGQKGRRCGETHGRAKLTDHEVLLVHYLHSTGMRSSEIGKKFGINRKHVWRIVNGLARGCTPEALKEIEVPKSKSRRR